MNPPLTTTRRSFLGAGLGAGLALALPSRGLARAQDEEVEPRRMLILGGTKFLGPAIVRAALDAGYEVTLFNRGKTNPHLFPNLEKLRGDRNKGELAALEGREFDFVVDTSGYVPAHVTQAAEVLADNIGHYVFVSTLSVYAGQGLESVDEDSEVTRIPDEEVEAARQIGDVFDNVYELYGPLKALCEEACEAVLPGRTTNLRAGLIVGPDDGTDRFTYWPVRVKRGGEVLAPGNPDAPVQFIDVRDLGLFAVRAGMGRKAGVFNCVGFEGRLTMQELLHGAKVVTGSDASFTWVSDQFLQENRVAAYYELPLWIPDGARNRYENSRGIEAGLTFRPVGDTLRDTLEWHEELRDPEYDFPGAGMQRDRESALLAAHRTLHGEKSG